MIAVSYKPGDVSRWLERHPRLALALAALQTMSVGGALADHRWGYAALWSVAAIENGRAFIVGRDRMRA